MLLLLWFCLETSLEVCLKSGRSGCCEKEEGAVKEAFQWKICDLIKKKKKTYQSNKGNFNSDKNNMYIKEEFLFAFGARSKREGNPARSPPCIWIAICLARRPHPNFMCAFTAQEKQKQICLPTWVLHDCVFCCCCCFFITCASLVRAWACSGVLRVRSEDVTPWSFITRGDTLCAALRDAQAMFYKRITRQAAPAGHPLPPRTRAHTHARMHAALADLRYSTRIPLTPALIVSTVFHFKIPFIHPGFCTVLQRLSKMEGVCIWHTHTHTHTNTRSTNWTCTGQLVDQNQRSGWFLIQRLKIMHSAVKHINTIILINNYYELG